MFSLWIPSKPANCVFFIGFPSFECEIASRGQFHYTYRPVGKHLASHFLFCSNISATVNKMQSTAGRRQRCVTARVCSVHPSINEATRLRDNKERLWTTFVTK